MSKNKKNIIRRLICWIGWILLFLFVGSVSMAVFYKFVPVYVTPLMIVRSLGNDNVGMEHQWVPIDKISPNLVRAVVASEDNLFMEHNGFDMQQIRKAIDERREGKRERGASTISQQTAKNVFLLPAHSFIRKGLEAYFTVLIEWIWGKERIMEVYLNSIEMGKGIYGAEKIARINFGKPAERLTAGESALIAATLPNPRRFSSARPSAYILKRQAQILDLMDKIGPVKFRREEKTDK